MASTKEEYVCNYNDDPKLKTAFEKLAEFMEHSRQRIQFMKKEAESLNDERNKLWRTCDELLQDKGYISKDLQLRFNDKGQIFSKPREERSTIEELLHHLFD